MLQEIRLPEPCIHAGLMSPLLQNGYACRSGKCPLSELERTSFGTVPKSDDPTRTWEGFAPSKSASHVCRLTTPVGVANPSMPSAIVAMPASLRTRSA